MTSLAFLASGLAGGGVVLGLAPAAGAATCASSGGVSVVVDYRELGGGVLTACATDGGGRSATAIVASVGVTLTYASRQPGFVCRVNGVPTSDPCVNASPADAYWGLWWADGSTPSWTYSSYASGSLTVPAGGSVGWSWQQDRAGSGAVPPGVAPPVHEATSTPSPSSSPTSNTSPTPSSSSSPTATPSGGGGSQPSGGATGSGGSSGGGTSGGGGSGTSPQATPSASPSSPSESPLASESPGDSRAKSGSKKGSDDGTVADESPGDSTASDDPEAAESDSESPEDSTPSAAPGAGEPSADEPSRIPAAVTWSIVGLLATAIAGSAVVARRRRGSDAP
jgi:uncharacterized membrane protein YgcG